MADRRMFTKKITESDAFLEMPPTSQNLYFHLNMEADDDGFVNAPKKIMRMIGASEDDMKLLLMKKFVLVFESGVIVIKHWKMHNLIRSDRYHPTQYQEEYKMLELDKENKYHMRPSKTEEIPMTTNWQPNDTQMETEVRLGKDRLDKVNEEDINIQRFREAFGDRLVDKALNLLKDYSFTEDNLLTLLAKLETGTIANPEGYVYTMMKGKHEFS